MEDFDIKNSCRTCMKTGCPLRSIFEIAVDDTSFAKIIVRLCLHFLMTLRLDKDDTFYSSFSCFLSCSNQSTVT